MPLGRPSSQTTEITQEICSRLADGESLRTICRDEHMPDRSTVVRWVFADETFYSQYARAREMQAENLADEIVEISDDGTNDWMVRQSDSEKGAGVNIGWVLNGEHVQRSRLRIDTRKWYLSKVLPKKFGEKIVAEHTGTVQQVIRWAATDAEGTNDPSITGD